jgi:hypothetical protein
MYDVVILYTWHNFVSSVVMSLFVQVTKWLVWLAEHKQR